MPEPRVGVRVRVQKLGTALSNMVMPNIGAFIAWGLITALFIKTGWLPGLFHGLQDPDGWVAKIGGWGSFESGGIVGPMITYLLPILIGATGGRMVYGIRGGVVGAMTIGWISDKYLRGRRMPAAVVSTLLLSVGTAAPPTPGGGAAWASFVARLAAASAAQAPRIRRTRGGRQVRRGAGPERRQGRVLPGRVRGASGSLLVAVREPS